MGASVPFYEYRRPDGTTLEVMQKMSDPPLTEDPDTGVPLQRVFHPIAVHFKGKGFYNTDYGTKNRQREKAAEEGAKSESAKSESGSGETKSADAAAPKGEKQASESTASKSPGETTSAAKK